MKLGHITVGLTLVLTLTGCGTTTTSKTVPAPTPTVTITPEWTPDPTARCKDGSYSYARNRSGACSQHGGVAVWWGPAES